MELLKVCRFAISSSCWRCSYGFIYHCTTWSLWHWKTDESQFWSIFFSMKEDLGTYIISTMNIGDKDIPGRCCVPCWCVKIWQCYYSANKCDFWLKFTSHSIFASFLSLCACLWALGKLLSCMLWNIHVIYRQYPVISQWLKCWLERLTAA